MKRLVCLAGLLLAGCEVDQVIAEHRGPNGEPCISVTANGVSKGSGGVNVQGVSVTSNPPCELIEGVDLTLYKERGDGSDSGRGYQSPPDQYVSHLSGQTTTGGQSSSIGSFSTSSATNGQADSWQITITHPGGSTTQWSGSF